LAGASICTPCHTINFQGTHRDIVEAWRDAGGVATWRHGGIEATAGVAIQRWWHGALEAHCRCSDVEVWKLGALEACCGLGDVEVGRYGGMEVWKSIRIEVWRYGGLEVWRCEGIELGALEARCRRRDVEVLVTRADARRSPGTNECRCSDTEV